jgi:hypothetical protein
MLGESHPSANSPRPRVIPSVKGKRDSDRPGNQSGGNPESSAGSWGEYRRRHLSAEDTADGVGKLPDRSPVEHS